MGIFKYILAGYLFGCAFSLTSQIGKVAQAQTISPETAWLALAVVSLAALLGWLAGRSES